MKWFKNLRRTVGYIIAGEKASVVDATCLQVLLELHGKIQGRNLGDTGYFFNMNLVRGADGIYGLVLHKEDIKIPAAMKIRKISVSAVAK